MKQLIDGERRVRREYSTAFKESVLAQTREPGASVSSVALRHGLHPNMVHRWLRQQRLARQQAQQPTPAFVPLPIPAVVADDHIAQPADAAATQAGSDGQLIRMQLQRAGATIEIAWPVTAATQCAQMLRALLQ